MKCPNCGQIVDKVIDSKTIEKGIAIYRRRECLACARTFTTYESMDNTSIDVFHKIKEVGLDKETQI